MAQRTIFECDRCHIENEPDPDTPGFPFQWSIVQDLRVTQFILCPVCTEALRKFMNDAGSTPVQAIEAAQVAASQAAPQLFDEADHSSDETMP